MSARDILRQVRREARRWTASLLPSAVGVALEGPLQKLKQRRRRLKGRLRATFGRGAGVRAPAVEVLAEPSFNALLDSAASWKPGLRLDA